MRASPRADKRRRRALGARPCPLAPTSRVARDSLTRPADTDSAGGMRAARKRTRNNRAADVGTAQRLGKIDRSSSGPPDFIFPEKDDVQRCFRMSFAIWEGS